MSLDTYANLKTEIQNWLVRSDMANDVDTCIDLFESWANRNLRVRQMEQEATTPAAEYIALPTDYLELRDIQWQGNPRIQLRYMTPQQADLYDPSGALGTPRYYTVIGGQLRLIRAPDTTTDVRIDYYKRIPALSGTQTTNWLLTEFPDAYLYGCLVQGRVRLLDPQQMSYVAEIFGNIVDEIEKAGRSSNYGSLLQMRRA